MLLKPTLPSEIEFRHQKIEPPIEVESGMHGFRRTVDAFDAEQHIFTSTMDSSLICAGYIIYLDGNGVRRQMGFCRKYNSVSNRWLTMDDPEYEYSY